MLTKIIHEAGGRKPASEWISENGRRLVQKQGTIPSRENKCGEKKNPKNKADKDNILKVEKMTKWEFRPSKRSERAVPIPSYDRMENESDSSFKML